MNQDQIDSLNQELMDSLVKQAKVQARLESHQLLPDSLTGLGWLFTRYPLISLLLLSAFAAMINYWLVR